MSETENYTDEELVTLSRKNDPSACEELLLRYKGRVLSIARRFFLTDGDTEDLVQEGMCGLYSAILSFKGEDNFSRYACACIHNRILDAVRRSSGRDVVGVMQPLYDEEEDVASSHAPEEALIAGENRKELTEAMKKTFSSLEFETARMYMDGATMTEIAKALDITYKQADNALSRAKRKLKDIISYR